MWPQHGRHSAISHQLLIDLGAGLRGVPGVWSPLCGSSSMAHAPSPVALNGLAQLGSTSQFETTNR